MTATTSTPRYTRNAEQEYDVVIVGSGMGAICAGAVLVNEGRKVAIVSEYDHIGGRYGATNHEGYWLPWGQRDGDGFADLTLAEDTILEAAERANVDVTSRPVVGMMSEVHLLPGGMMDDRAVWTWPVRSNPGALEAAKGMLRASHPGLDDEQLERLGEEFVDVVTELASMSQAEAFRLVPVTVRDWMTARQVSAQVWEPISQVMEMGALTPPIEVSAGRLADRLRGWRGEWHVPDVDAVGGMQGYVELFARRYEECGGELWLGWKPLEISLRHQLDDPEVTGVVAVDPSNLVRRFHAPVVITDYNGWRLPELVDSSLLPREFLARAEVARRESGTDFIGWAAGLSRIPTRVSDGKVEDVAMHRFLGGRSVTRGYVGGYAFITELDGGRSAPPGKHLLFLWSQRANNSVRARDEHDADRSFPSWDAAQDLLDQMLEEVWTYYQDMDACIDWAQYMYQRAPHGIMWRLRVAEYLHSVDISTIEGLFVVSQTAEDHHFPLEIDTALALKAIDLAAMRRGHLWQ